MLVPAEVGQVTVNVPCPPAAETDAVRLDGLNTGVTVESPPPDAAWVTVLVMVFGKDVVEPAVTMILPLRTDPVVFADAVTEILPLPEVPEVARESQLADFVALQEVFAVTETVAEAAPEDNETLAGLVASETRMLPQSQLLNAEPEAFTASIQYQYFTPGVSPLEA